MSKTANNDVQKVFGFSVRAAEMTSELLRSIMRDYVQNKANYEFGETDFAKLSEQSTDKNGNLRLETIPISDKNIGDFRDTARKYDLSYALKCDSSKSPPEWQVYFKNDKGTKDTIDRAFREFAEKKADG